MKKQGSVAVVGTFDTKAEEHRFLKECIEQRGIPTLTVNVGTRGSGPFPVDFDLYPEIEKKLKTGSGHRDEAIQTALALGRALIKERHGAGEIAGIISAGGGTGTHIGTGIMHALPLGVPKVMVSTVASRNMANIVGTKDITMMHSVVDLLGVNSISGRILEKAAAAVSGMIHTTWEPVDTGKRIALTFFGFITPAAEEIKRRLDEMGYEVIAFHANGTGGMAMEELAREGYFHGILDLAIHELADALMDGYCGGIGPERLELPTDGGVPRLVVPGGMDCAVLEFTRNSVPERFKDRKIFFYDFRSAIRLNLEESRFLSEQLAEKLNRDPARVKMLVPSEGWSYPDRMGGPLYDPEMNEAFLLNLKEKLDPRIQVKEVKYHINDPGFAEAASALMDEMLRSG